MNYQFILGTIKQKQLFSLERKALRYWAYPMEINLLNSIVLENISNAILILILKES